MTFDYAATKKRGWLAYDACLPHALNIPLLNRVRVYVSIVSIDMVGKPFGGEVVVSVNINLDGQPPVSVLFTVDEVRVRSGSAP